jgi:hypothetical protein
VYDRRVASDIYVPMCMCVRVCMRAYCAYVCVRMYVCAMRVRMYVRVCACAYNVEFEILSGVGDTNGELHDRVRLNIMY